jgi:signal transduction histidine kinase
VVLEVADRGPGIPEDEADKIFEAFYRIGNEATRTAPGTGLGLHLCYLQARALGGEMSVHAREGGGSVFRVRLEPAD